AGPDSRSPTRLESVDTAHVEASSRVHSPDANQSARGPGPMRNVSGVRRTAGAASTGGREAGAPSDSTAPPVRTGGPTPARVSVEREPSTGSTAMPPANAT